MSRALAMIACVTMAACSTQEPAPDPNAGYKPRDNTVATYFERAPRRPDVAAYPPVREHVLIPVPEGRSFVVVRVMNHERPKPLPAPVFTPAPAEPVAKTVESIKGTAVIDEITVFFDFDLYKLSNEAKSKLDGVVKRMGSLGTASVRVEGHTDSDGAASHNMSPSERRQTGKAYFCTPLTDQSCMPLSS